MPEPLHIAMLSITCILLLLSRRSQQLFQGFSRHHDSPPESDAGDNPLIDQAINCRLRKVERPSDIGPDIENQTFLTFLVLFHDLPPKSLTPVNCIDKIAMCQVYKQLFNAFIIASEGILRAK